MYTLRSNCRSTRLKFKIPKKPVEPKTVVKPKTKLTTTKKKEVVKTQIKTVPKKATAKVSATKRDVPVKKPTRTKKKDAPLGLDNDSLMKQLADLKNLSTWDTDDKKLALVDPLMNMKRHEKLKCKVLMDYLACLKTYGNNKWTKLLHKIPFQISDGTTIDVPLIIVVCSGPPTNTKKGIANQSLIDWNATTRKKTGNKFCEWYEPGTQNQRIRTFFGEVSKKYGWQMKLKDFNYHTLLMPFLARLYKKRRAEYKAVSYGIKNPNRKLTYKQMNKIDLLLFDESDPKQHLIKMMFAFGTQFALRGGEHVELEMSNLSHGVFEEGHPLAGLEWFGLTNMKDKTLELSVHNNHLRCDDDFLRSPVYPGCFICLGGIIKRYLPKITPGQVRLYCYPMSPTQKIAYVRNGESCF